MKKTLLLLSLFAGLGLTGKAQNFTPQVSGLPANNFIGDIQPIDANVVWGTSGAVVNNSVTYNTYLRTTNGGTSWQGGLINTAGLSSYGVGGLHAIDATTAWAAIYPAAAGGSNAILKTTDGGTTWTRQTTAAFSSSTSFANWVYFWNANEGVCMGDPSVAAGSSVPFFEIYTTTNGGTTWTRVPRTTAITPPSGEYGIVNQYTVVGNTIWFLTGYDAGVQRPVRVFKSTDKGLTWSAGTPTGFLEQASGITFANANNGLVWDGVELASSSDGGATWNTQPVSTPFRRASTTAIPNSNVFVSVGLDARVTGTSPFPAADFGVSVSRNFGVTWQTISTGASYGSVGFASGTVGWVAGDTGPAGTTGLARYTGANILSNRNTDLQQALAAYPNPSNTGVFTVQLAAGLKTGATIRVFDVVGRQVAAQTLNATAIAAKSTTVDLSNEKAGIYTLELRTDAGVAQQKLVVE